MLMVLVAAVSLGWTQEARNIRIDPAGETVRAYLSYMDAAAESVFAKMYEIPRYQDYKPFALLLTNLSGQAIVSVTIRWTGVSGGKTVVQHSSCDSVMRGLMGAVRSSGGSMNSHDVLLGSSGVTADGPIVLAPGERMLVAPGLLARESQVKQRGSPTASSSMPAALQSATNISASLDTVVLEDGTVLGPDESHTIDGMLAQKTAGDFVVQAVRTAEQNGMDGAEALRILANPQSMSRGMTQQDLAAGSIARALMGSRDWRAQLERIAAFQLPNFHRQ
jgi:hypothetical protein